MSKSINFCFVTHNHQPIGNFDNVIEEAYSQSYKPFFEVAAKYPDFRFGTHFTGILLDWLEQKHPEYLEALRTMCSSGQLEMVTGGFYEPILSIIPTEHQHRQISKLTARIEQLFHQTPTSMWLAERVWEQQLAGVLCEQSVRSVFLDDTHFVGAGLRDSDLIGYYMTEDQGRPLAVFPISKPLRYTMPFRPVDETIAVLKEAASEEGSAFLCFADDGEKFGVWPNTFAHVYEEGWLEELMAKLSENKSWVSMKTPVEVVSTVKPKGRIYLPNSSYAEMMHWALPTAETYLEFDAVQHQLGDEEASQDLETIRPYVRGGYWRNFLVKYPEVNHLHKHILRSTSRLDEQQGSLDADTYEKILDDILAAECNDPFWHGVFGGLYLPNLRHGNYSRLLSADRALDAVQGIARPIDTSDFDLDGFDDLVIETEFFSLYFEPRSGGRLTELDVKPRSFNVINAVQRRMEGYHAKLTETSDGSTKEARSIHDMVQSKEEGLEKHLHYDWYPHTGFQEHFFFSSINVEELRNMTFTERGSFLGSHWGLTAQEEDKGFTISGVQRGSVRDDDGVAQDVEVSKSLHVSNGLDGVLRITYTALNRSSDTLALLFGSEWFANFLAGDADDRYFSINNERIQNAKLRNEGDASNVSTFSITDEWLKLRMRFDFESPVRFVTYPLETVSQSESGFERVYQGSVLMPLWQVVLKPNEPWKIEFQVKFELL